MKKFTRRVVTGVAGLSLASGLALGTAAVASAGTVPVTGPGEPSVAMTITNHTDRNEFLVSSNSGDGNWVNAPKWVLGPGTSETVTAVAPSSGHLEVDARYDVGVGGPTANYRVNDLQIGANTLASGVVGSQYWMNTSVQTGYPTVNATFDQW